MSKTLLRTREIIPVVSWHFPLFIGESTKPLLEMVACNYYVMDKSGLLDATSDRLTIGKYPRLLSDPHMLHDFFRQSVGDGDARVFASYFGLMELYSEDGVTFGDLILTKWECH